MRMLSHFCIHNTEAMDSNYILTPVSLNDLADIIGNQVSKAIRQSIQATEPAPHTTTELPIDFKQAMRVLGMKERTLRAKIASNEIPYYQPSPRQLYFFESELIGYIKSGRVKTSYELEEEARNYTKRRK